MPASVHALRDLLATRFPGAVPVTHRTAPVAATGVSALDGILPGGGLPRGRLSAWAPNGGSAALLRAACRSAVRRGERAAWIDAAGTLGGELWREGPLLARPRTELQAVECAEELARSGAFGLIVFSGSGTEEGLRVRLVRAAREGGGALVEVSAQGFMAAVRLVSCILPSGVQWRTAPRGERIDVRAVAVRVRAVGLGWSREAILSLSFASGEHRLSLEPALADRRGAAR